MKGDDDDLTYIHDNDNEEHHPPCHAFITWHMACIQRDLSGMHDSKNMMTERRQTSRTETKERKHHAKTRRRDMMTEVDLSVLVV